MEKENSWLRRTKFSHTVYTRLDCHWVPIAPLDRDVEQKLQRFVSMGKSVSMPVNRDEDAVAAFKHSVSLPTARSSLQLNKEKANKKKADFEIPSSPPVNSVSSKGLRARSLVKSPSSAMLLSYLNKARPNQDSGLKKADGPHHKPRSKSPLPSVVPSDVFREARASSKRFTSPPPKRRGSERSIYGKSLGRQVSDMSQNPDLHSTPVTSDKHNSVKDSSWTKRYFDNGGRRRVSALDTTEIRRNHGVSMAEEVQTTVDWTLDPSKLLVGHKFASGAYSRLFKGLYDDKPVAIKFIRQTDDDDNGKMAAKLAKQYNSEINALSHLYHKNVIKLVAAYKCPPVFYIITEFLDGGSLRSYLNSTEHHPIPLEKIISIALDIARGLEYIHSQGVVHRDIKPENILFDGNFCVKIADFGIACEETLCDALVEDEGTYRWMAPEMIKRKAYNRKVDVYSFGLLLWEMVSGRIPFDDLTPLQAAYAVATRHARPIIPPECPMALRPLIEQCCALQPEKRPDFWQIVKTLEEFHSVLSQGGCLDSLKNSNCQDQKKRLLHWIQKLKPSHST
uniref:Protein kinase domain-containing protein n=1 Tax=Leersia perrieri TaxID=77586 RepID=A0A0D9UY02_9ORYZ